MTKHTPGPWGPMVSATGSQTDRDPYKETTQKYLEAAPGLDIGATCHTEPICRVSGYLQPLEANARLIAAAPDLLEALVAAEEALAIAASYLDEHTTRLQVVLDNTRDVLAQARGEQQGQQEDT